MSNISVDLKVIETHVPSVARAAGVTEDRVLAGLIRLWHRCWSVARAHLSRVEIAGAFGPERLDELLNALSVDFLELQEDGSFRVRGADQYLRIKEGRRRGAEKTNRAMAERRSSDAQATLNRTLPNALSPNTEHRAPNTEHQAAAVGPVSIDDFWRAAQDERTRVTGLAREVEPNPRQLSAWASEAMLEANGDIGRLWAGYLAFLQDPFWRLDAQTKCAWRGWLNQWRTFLPATAGAGPPPTRTAKSSTRAPVAAESVDWSTVVPGEVQL